MIDKIWLFFMNLCSSMCHQKMERSFFVKNYQLPVCARCTGLFIGYIVGVIGLFLSFALPLYMSIIFVIIMFIDGFIQLKKIKESTNTRRVITGFFCGVSVISLLSFFVMFLRDIF